jgi:hypothetical protein
MHCFRSEDDLNGFFLGQGVRGQEHIGNMVKTVSDQNPDNSWTLFVQSLQVHWSWPVDNPY